MKFMIQIVIIKIICLYKSKLINNFCKLYGNPEETVIGFGDFEQYQHRKFKEPVKGKGNINC